MRPLHTFSVKDLGEINAFLSALQDGDEYKKRLKALEDQKKEINALIEVYGKANDIDRIRSNALRDEEQAKKILAEALEDRKNASSEVEKSRESAKKFVGDKMDEANRLFTERERSVAAGEKRLGDWEKVLGRKETELAAREALAEQAMEAARQDIEKYTKAAQRLSTTLEEIARTL